MTLASEKLQMVAFQTSQMTKKDLGKYNLMAEVHFYMLCYKLGAWMLDYE